MIRKLGTNSIAVYRTFIPAFQHSRYVRPILNILRDKHHIYAQITDFNQGFILTAEFSMEKVLKARAARRGAAKLVGKTIAKKALAAGITEVVFDCGVYIDYGILEALLVAAHKGGLNF